MRVYRPRLGGNIYLANLNDSFDPVVQAFVAAQTSAGQTLTSTEIQALNSLVLSGKSNGWWSAQKAFHPYVGGTATSHSFNLVNPTIAQITWNGTVIHNSNGITPDGGTGYGDTGLAMNDVAFTNSLSFGAYCRTDEGGNVVIMGVNDVNIFQFLPNFAAGQAIVDNPIAARLFANYNTPLRTQLTSYLTSANTVYQDGINIGSATGTQSPLSTGNMYIGARNDSGSAAAFSNVNQAASFIGTGLTGPQAVAMCADLQVYQTALGRQV